MRETIKATIGYNDWKGIRYVREFKIMTQDEMEGYAEETNVIKIKERNVYGTSDKLWDYNYYELIRKDYEDNCMISEYVAVKKNEED